MNVHDIIVVGAGPAGSIAARGLARDGLRVLMVDKAHFPRRKVCGCCLNGNALAALENVGLGDLHAKLGAASFNGFTTASKGRIASVPLKGVSLSREAFDMALIEEAVNAGVEFREGVTFGSRSGGTSSPCHTQVTIYANGLNGVPSTASKSSRLGGGTILDEAPAYYESGRIYMAVGQGGYVGLVRLEDGRLDVAAAFDPEFVRVSGGLGNAAERIVKVAGFTAITNLVDSDWKGTPALTRTPERIAGPGWLAIGDAAGYVEPFTGEGMAWAISGAAAVVPFVHQMLGGDAEAAMKGWTKQHAKIIAQRQRTCRKLARLLRSPGIYGWVVRSLNRFPSLARPIVNAINKQSLDNI